MFFSFYDVFVENHTKVESFSYQGFGIAQLEQWKIRVQHASSSTGTEECYTACHFICSAAHDRSWESHLPKILLLWQFPRNQQLLQIEACGHKCPKGFHLFPPGLHLNRYGIYKHWMNHLFIFIPSFWFVLLWNKVFFCPQSILSSAKYGVVYAPVEPRCIYKQVTMALKYGEFLF